VGGGEMGHYAPKSEDGAQRSVAKCWWLVWCGSKSDAIAYELRGDDRSEAEGSRGGDECQGDTERQIEFMGN